MPDNIARRLFCSTPIPDPETPELGESKAFLKLLEKHSPVFKQQSRAALRNQNLLIDDFSPKAWKVFLDFYNDNSRYFSGYDECGLLLEVYQLADKYKLDKLAVWCEEEADGLRIYKSKVFETIREVLKKTHLPNLKSVSKIILSKCAEKIHLDQLDVLELWTKYGKKDGEALAVLNQHLSRLRNQSEDEICQNCRVFPCLDGQPVKQFHVGLKVSQLVDITYEINDLTSKKEEGRTDELTTCQINGDDFYVYAWESRPSNSKQKFEYACK